MGKFFNTVGRLTKIEYSANDEEKIVAFLNEIASDVEQQRVFFDYCKKSKIAAWVYLRLKENAFLSYFEIEIMRLFEEQFQNILLQNEARNEAVKKVLKAFVANNIDVIVLKGNVFTQTIYKSFGYKRMNDFDILIRKEDWPKIQDIYSELDFIPLGFGWTGEKHQATDFSHTGIPYISRNFKCMIGSQWGLKAPTSSYCMDIEEIWSTAEEFDFYGLKLKKLSPKNNLQHLILHLGVYKCGVRDCMDIYNLLLTEDIEKQNLQQELIKAKALDKAFFALNLCNEMAGIPDAEILNLTNNGKSSLLKRMFQRRMRAIKESQDWQVSYNDYFQDIEKNVIYFSIFHEFHIKLGIFLKIIRQLFFPKTEIALKLIEKAHRPTLRNKIKAFFVAPYYVFVLLAEEVGLKAVIFILLKLFVNLIGSVFNYFKPKQNYFDYLKKQGIDPQLVKNLVNNVQ